MKPNRLTLTIGALLAIVATIVSACNTSGCLDNRSSVPMAGFYSSADGEALVLDSLAIGGVGAPDDSLLLAPGHSATFVYLPLRQMQSSASFFISYRWSDLDDPALNDTVTFDYEAIPYFASEECGALQLYHLRRVTHTRHMLDSVAVLPRDSIINNVPVENLRFYFVTDTEATEEEEL